VDSSLAGDTALLVGAALLAAAVLLSLAAERFRAPALLVFLALGMIIGDDGLGWVSFDDAALAQRIGVIALVVILFEGGLANSVSAVRRVAAPAALLSTIGVAVTALVVAVTLVVATSTTFTTAALIGAVVASTDAAAVFSMLRRAPVSRRLGSFLEAESGGNDPMAVLLTIGILATWSGQPSGIDWVVFGVVQLVGGLVVGALVGWLVATLLRRVKPDSPTLYAVLAFAGGGLAYGLGALVGASGFLAVFVAGLIIGSSSSRYRRAMQRFFEGLATIAQITLFLMLGLLVFPSQLPDVLGVGLVVAATLMFVARPVAVFACLSWFRFTVAERTLVSWAGLRGAVPIVLATIPLTAGYPDGSLVFDTVFFVVLTSALVQGLTIGPLARRLGLTSTDPTRDLVADLVPLDAVGVDVIEVELTTEHAVVGRTLREVPLPAQVRIGAILRGDQVMVPDGATRLAAADLLIVVAPSADDMTDRLALWAGSDPMPG
jgi:cell volume regulation protein A